MAGAARVALPHGGNPVTSPGAKIDFVYPDSGGQVAPKPASTPGAADADVISLVGFMVYETAGSTAKLRLHDGLSAAAPVLTPTIALTANANSSAALIGFTNGIEINSGNVFVEVISGSVEVVLYW